LQPTPECHKSFLWILLNLGFWGMISKGPEQIKMGKAWNFWKQKLNSNEHQTGKLWAVVLCVFFPWHYPFNPWDYAIKIDKIGF
jgi:hypothetical protein